MADQRKIIAVVGATGNQGGSVLRTLKERERFRVRALTRRPEAYPGPADEVALADLHDPETLRHAFEGTYGVFLVTNFWELGAERELRLGKAAVQAARRAGVEHLVWSTLPDVESISGGEFVVPHFTQKAKVDAFVRDAGFTFHTFVQPPFYYQNLTGAMAPGPLPDGRTGWLIPIASNARVIHAGDIDDLGNVVAGAFERPDEVGDGQYLSLAAEQLSFDDIVSVLNEQGHRLAVQTVSGDAYTAWLKDAGMSDARLRDEMLAMFRYWERYTYMGPDADGKIALARKIATGPFTDFATWARQHMPAERRR